MTQPAVPLLVNVDVADLDIGIVCFMTLTDRGYAAADPGSR